MIASSYRCSFSASEKIPYYIPPNNVYSYDQMLVNLRKYGDSQSEIEQPKEQSWSVRSGPPIPKMIDAPEEEARDWNDPAYDVLFDRKK